MSRIEKIYSEGLCETVYHIYHDSGLFISYVPKKRVSSQAVIYVNFGGECQEYTVGDERVTIPMGCAHFLEHKMFDNPDGTNADEIINSYGGYTNAFTSYTKTAYFFSTTENFYECLYELVRMVTSPYFTDATVKKEMGIIAEEIRGCIDDPYDRCHTNMLSALYQKNTVKNEICGTEKSIRKITPEILYRCCRDFYVPENMGLCISGDLDVDKIIETVDKIMPMASGYSICRERYDEPSEVALDYTDTKMPLGKPICCIGMKINDIPQDKRERLRQSMAIDILCRMVFSESEDFYRELLDENLISPSFDCGASSTRSYSYIAISTETTDPRTLMQRVKEKISSLGCGALDSETFAQAFEREKMCDYAGFVSDFDSTEDISFMLMSYSSGKDRLNLFEYIDILDSIDMDYVKMIARERLNTDSMALSVVYPLD